MEPKRFIGNDLNRLLARIRRELGPDALIVRTRSLLREGAEPLVEVLAAGAPAPGDDLPPVLQRTMMQSVLSRLDPSVTVGDIEDMIVREAPSGAQTAPPSFAFPEPSYEAPAEPRARPPFDESVLLDQLAAELERRSQSTALRPADGSDTLSAPRPLASSPRPGLSGDLRSQLRAAGFSNLTAEAVHELASGETSPVWALSTTLERGVLTYPDEDQTAILTVQGANAVGRTTALLRMALDCAHAGRPAVAVSMTGDAGSAARLRAFAHSAGMQFEVGRDWKGVGKLARSVEPGACLFLDVPAGPWRMPLPVGVRHFCYLAVPALADPGQLAAALDSFDLRPFSGAVLTFGDRARTLRPAVDFLIRAGLGVAFVSDGPDPATGIAAADPLTLASGCFTTATRDVTNGQLPAIA